MHNKTKENRKQAKPNLNHNGAHAFGDDRDLLDVQAGDNSYAQGISKITSGTSSPQKKTDNKK